MDPAQVLKKVTKKTKAIIPVHLFGLCADIDDIKSIIPTHLKIIEDAACAVGASYNGKWAGSLGDAASFSFHPRKSITTGEGGMLVTNDDDLADTIRIKRLQGISRDAWKRFGKSGFAHWEQTLAGHKCNMTDLNASLGLHQIKKVERFMTLRKKYVSMYDNAFADVPELETLAVRDYVTSAHHIYIIALQLECLTVDRDGFLDAIQSAGIGVAVHYVALHLQPYYVKNFNTKPQDFPIASNYSERVISLPLYPKMSSADVERVIGTVKDLVKNFRR